MTLHRLSPTLLFLCAGSLGFVLVLGLGLGFGGAPRAEDSAAVAERHAGHSGETPMTEEAMRRSVEDWFSRHPIVGQSAGPAAVIADTFLVGPGLSNRFDSDGNLNTVVDTAKIEVGQSVLWRWISGIHTVTSGNGGTDPQAGALFNRPSDSANPQFVFQFDNAGTVPFFCSPHEAFNMRGVVVVKSTVGVDPHPDAVRALGFTAGPSPNPTRSTTRFRFALREPGRARVEVLDTQGRLVAVILDRELGPGSYAEAWDGLGGNGRPVSAGVYHLRLRLPGFADIRRVVVTR